MNHPTHTPNPTHAFTRARAHGHACASACAHSRSSRSSVLICAAFASALFHLHGASLPPGIDNSQRAGDQPLPPREALARITVPEGFNVTLFAGEPDVQQPIAFDMDDRGRLWVAECYSYPEWKTSRDRILIFTDRDQDGEFDERKVFYDQGNRFTGVLPGFGGVWVTAAPNLLFFPDRDGNDVPDGEPEVKLTGFTKLAGHNSVNGLAWSPDGWLYGRHGISAASKVGPPGAPESERVELNCSIWRYHPLTGAFEVVTHGTTNPWGLDFDDHGQPFFSNNVIGHLWHVVPGAHYKRMFGTDYNPHIYELMDACADHLHWSGQEWQRARGGAAHESLGGGHSHTGGMIYLGDNWPDRYRGAMFINNIHGNRMLFDTFERQGSGYTARHGGDFLKANDPWFRGITLQYGPDGGVFVSDWNDLGECHDEDGSYRGSGRIYKITYGKPKSGGELDLAARTDAELAQLLLHRNDWFVRHARRLLQERAAQDLLKPDTARELEKLLEHPDVTRQLRAAWALRSIGAVDSTRLVALLEHPSEHLRWWAIQWICEPGRVEPVVLKALTRHARDDKSAMVRLSLASALQRLPLAQRWEVAFELVAHEEDAEDQNLPHLIWYAIEPLVGTDPRRTLELVAHCKIPAVRQFLTRRLAAQ